MASHAHTYSYGEIKLANSISINDCRKIVQQFKLKGWACKRGADYDTVDDVEDNAIRQIASNGDTSAIRQSYYHINNQGWKFICDEHAASTPVCYRYDCRKIESKCGCKRSNNI